MIAQHIGHQAVRAGPSEEDGEVVAGQITTTLKGLQQFGLPRGTRGEGRCARRTGFPSGELQASCWRRSCARCCRAAALFR